MVFCQLVKDECDYLITERAAKAFLFLNYHSLAPQVFVFNSFVRWRYFAIPKQPESFHVKRFPLVVPRIAFHFC